MKPTNWDKLATRYSAVQESRRTIVFDHVHSLIKKLRPITLLDYGGGDGVFATICADIPALKIVSYDSSPAMRKLALKNCRPYSQISIADSTSSFEDGVFDIITSQALWMCLRTERKCLHVLSEIRRLLAPNGIYIASVTHPCFRTQRFSSYYTDFDLRNYLKDGTRFIVTISDGKRKMKIVDTHWTLSAMSKQLAKAGFVIMNITELSDSKKGGNLRGSPWMVFTTKIFCNSL